MFPLGPSQPRFIAFDCTDEEAVQQLQGILSGASLPSNVITDVNPYHVFPEYLPADIWYLFNSVGDKPSDTGYWKVLKKDDKIITCSTTTGSRITLEYYLGQEPTGIKTDWMMHKYMIIQNPICDTAKLLDARALFRVFLNYGENLNSGNRFSNTGTQDAEGKIMKVNADSGSCSQVSTNMSMNLGHGNPDRHVQGLPEINDLPEDDFLELLDLVDPESSSSNSENSSVLTFSSDDDCFNSSALLQELEEDIQRKQPKHTEKKCQAAAPLGAKKVVHEADSLGINLGLQSGEDPTALLDKQFANSTDQEHLIAARAKVVASPTQGIDAYKTDQKNKGVAGRITKRVKKCCCFVPF
ncbi:hypothetical protein Sjap_010439 [Stephania japonica]|uniref:NAC domain-containing protein n=1 Tax=Stephania japonica TaxID=461633 RepID=A0AAP0P3M9_9MAGN